MKSTRTGMAMVAIATAALSVIFFPPYAMAAAPTASYSGPMPEMHWRNIGPFRGGRTRAAAGVPDQPNAFYIGQVDGGVWKTTDYGRTWNPIFDQQDTQSIGAIAVAPSNNSVVYAASGEGLHRPDLSVGDGIYRSDDAGKSWTHLGLRNGEQIPAIAVDPTNPMRLFAAVLGHPYGPSEERGIFRSEDGGKTWTKVLYRDPSTGGSDVVIDPKNPQVVYGSLWSARLGPWEDANSYETTNGGLFKSTDGGGTWKQLKVGLPADLTQINVAVAASDPSRLYATISTKIEGGYASGKGLGVYRSDDAGETWKKITEDPRPAMKIGGGDLPVPVVDPTDPDVVYSTSIVTVRSTDGGKSWMSLRGAPGGDDYQNMWINPRDPKVILLVSDQGAAVSVNGGESWGSWYNQPTAQLYHVAATHTFPYEVCAGQQESGSVCIASRGNDGEINFRDWHPAGIIEYGYAAPDPLHPHIIFGAGRTEVSRYDQVTGQVQNVTPLPMRNKEFRADRTEPILFSPVDPHRMYYAANHLFQTLDGGQSWQIISPDLSAETTGQPASVPTLTTQQQAQRRGAIYSLAASYKNTQTLWAGTDDGLVWITRDGGQNWSKITPPGIAPWSKIAQMDASRFDDDTAYVAVNGERIDDMQPHAFVTHDGGKSWTSIVNGLPDCSPVNAVRADPEQRGLLYAATETGVYVSMNDGQQWEPLEYNLPHTSMRDLLVKDDDLIVATHGRAFWILDDVTPLRQLTALDGKKLPMLLKPADAWRVRRDTNTDTPLPPDEPAGENPPDGALIDYDLPASMHGTVTIEVLDNTGALVRRYSSTDPVVPSEAVLRTELIPPYWPLRTGPLPTTPGLHRIVWNLHATSPMATNYSYPISAVAGRTPLAPEGPLVLPGTYTVRITADDKHAEAPLVVNMDPRVSITPAELDAMHSASVAMAATLDRVGKADLEAHAVEEQLDAYANKSLGVKLKPYQEELESILDGPKQEPENPAAAISKNTGQVSVTGHEPSVKQARTAAQTTEPLPGLDDVTGEATALYGQIEAADAAPTDALNNASAHVREEARAVLPSWERFEQKELPALNRLLLKEHKQAVDVYKLPTDMAEAGDED
jgi:photosystem II stability/assembly factor-like uncharacterized protein